MKGECRVECKKWSAMGKCRKASAEGKCRKASADREPTTDVNTLGGSDHVRISKCLRQNSARGRREGLVQMGVPTMRVRAESVPTFNFLQKWFRTLAKGETKSNKNKIFEEV